MKLILAIAILFFSTIVAAKEPIKIFSPYSASHSGTPALRKIIDRANQSQNIFNFVLEFRPGGQQIIAVKAMDSNSLAIIAPAFVENVAAGKLTESDYVPVHALGDACWVVILNTPISSMESITVGGVGVGNASHLTALAIGEKHNLGVDYIVFKSNNDALVNMAGNHGTSMVIDRYEAFQSLRSANSKLVAFAVSCPVRIPQAPEISTLSELGITAPHVFNIVVSLSTMDFNKRNQITKILGRAQEQIGADEIYKISGIKIPKVDPVTFYIKSIKTVREMQAKYRAQITQSQR
jgi:hypothetical protein